MKIGFIGLGKMGSRMVMKLLLGGIDVVVWNRSIETIENFKSQISNLKLKQDQLKIAKDVQELLQMLSKPRVVWLMLPAGEATKNILNEVSKFVEKDDIIIDGGNSHFTDTQRRFEEFNKKGIRFLGIGVSGGLLAAENGYPLMVGGDKSAYEFVQTVLKSLSSPHGGYDYFGIGGAGHFVKMTHNAIEYGMMQAIGEGFGILEKSSYAFDLLRVAKVWQKGTIVSGFLADRVKDALEKDPALMNVSGIIDATGEAEWALQEAKKEQVPVEITEKSLEFRKLSQTDKKIQHSFAAKLIAALRREFGGHKVKEHVS